MENWARYGISKFGCSAHPPPEVAGEVQNATFEVALQFEFLSDCFENWYAGTVTYNVPKSKNAQRFGWCQQELLDIWSNLPAKCDNKPVYLFSNILHADTGALRWSIIILYHICTYNMCHISHRTMRFRWTWLVHSWTSVEFKKCNKYISPLQSLLNTSWLVRHM